MSGSRGDFRRLLLLVLFFVLPAVARGSSDGTTAGPTRYLIRPVYSNVRFAIVKWAVIKEEGQFRDFSGTLDYDPAHPERSVVEVTVDARSLDTKNDTRDETVRSPDFLDVARFPSMTFKSASVDPTGSPKTVSGDLTIHGVTRRVRFPVSPLGLREIPNVGKLVGFETTFTINRRDFGVLGSKWGAIPGVLDDEIQIHIVVGGVRPANR
jgi:polyisoprenoid-binding protein YceI